MNRRDFLKIVFTGISSYAARYLVVPPTIRFYTQVKPSLFHQPAAFDSFDLYELFGAYASRVGADVIDELRNTRTAINERDRINGIMGENGYTDFSSTEYFRRGSTRRGNEFYLIRNENGLDVCAPFFPNYTPDTKKPLFESAAVIGVNMASAQYEYENSRATASQVANIFLPKDHISNAGLAAFLTNPVRTRSIHETANGELEVNFTPGARYSDGEHRVQVEARGEIEFDATYPFSIV